jgi:hypothetical protein
MKPLRKIIEILIAVETRLTRRKATRRATSTAVRMVLNGCRV